MKSNPKISIIIPVYNGKMYVKEALDSALAQTYQNTEIIVVNDGSKDDGATRKIIQDYVKKHPDKITYYEKENGGVSTALNLALEKMTGEYFSWLSHDDRYYPQKLEKQVEYLQNFDENTILYSDYDLMDEYSNVFAFQPKDHKELMQKKEYALLRGAINGITLLIPKKAFEVCGNFRLDLRCTQDYELWLRMMINGFVFVHQPLLLATTRLHQNQVTNTNPKVISEGNQLWIDIIEAFSDDKKKELDKTVYDYYVKSKEFMLTTPYEGTIEYLDKKIKAFDDISKQKAKDVLVSVIIPFYNRVELVKNAIDSVLNQTHKNFEILLVNDGTKDVSALEQYLKNEKIRLIDIGENKGVSNARNVGIQNAKGTFVAFLDSDDTFVENKLEEQISYMLSTEAEFSYTGYIADNGVEQVEICRDIVDNAVEKCIKNCPVATPTVMAKTELLIKNNIFYDTKKTLGEDTCFYLDILKHTDIKFVNKCLTKVNINENSSAYNEEKLAKGLKAVLSYVLEDEEYFKQDDAIAYLCIGIARLRFPEEFADYIPPQTAPVVYQTRAKKYLKALIKKGPAYCVKRFACKLRNKLKR